MNRIQFDGAAALSEVIQYNNVLSSLSIYINIDLCHNNIGSKGVSRIVSALKVNKTLKILGN